MAWVNVVAKKYETINMQKEITELFNINLNFVSDELERIDLIKESHPIMVKKYTEINKQQEKIKNFLNLTTSNKSDDEVILNLSNYLQKEFPNISKETQILITLNVLQYKQMKKILGLSKQTKTKLSESQERDKQLLQELKEIKQLKIADITRRSDEDRKRQEKLLTRDKKTSKNELKKIEE